MLCSGCVSERWLGQGPWLWAWAWSPNGARLLESWKCKSIFCMWEVYGLLWPEGRPGQGRHFFPPKDAHKNTSWSKCSSRIFPAPLSRDGVQCPLLTSVWVFALPITNRIEYQRRWCGFHLAQWNTSRGRCSHCISPVVQTALRPPCCQAGQRTHERRAWPPNCSCTRPETSLLRLLRTSDPQLIKMTYCLKLL